MKKTLLISCIAVAMMTVSSYAETPVKDKKTSISPEVRREIDKKLLVPREEVLKIRVKQYRDMADSLERQMKVCKEDLEAEKCKAARTASRDLQKKYETEIKVARGELKTKRDEIISKSKN